MKTYKGSTVTTALICNISRYRDEWLASHNSCFNAGEGSTASTEQEARQATGLVSCSG